MPDPFPTLGTPTQTQILSTPRFTIAKSESDIEYARFLALDDVHFTTASDYFNLLKASFTRVKVLSSACLTVSI